MTVLLCELSIAVGLCVQDYKFLCLVVTICDDAPWLTQTAQRPATRFSDYMMSSELGAPVELRTKAEGLYTKLDVI